MKLRCRHIGWCAVLLVLGACGDDGPAKVSGSISVDMEDPVPGAPLTVDINALADGGPLAGATVVLFTDTEGISGGFGIETTEVEPGVYRAEVTLQQEGIWNFSATISSGSLSGRVSAEIDATCRDDRGMGQSCCGSEQCGGELWCDAFACVDGARPDGIICEGADQCGSGFCTNGLCASPWDIIGTGDGTPDSVNLQIVVGSRLNTPTDVAFDPSDGELWIASRSLDQLTVVPDVTDQTSQPVHFYDRSKHFLEEVVTLSFGDNGTFGTCGESRNTYDDLRAANDFMGPALWPADMNDFMIHGPDASQVHLDMLHNSPNCMGIEADTGNAFFAFNGLDGVLDHYDFHEPHPDQTHGGEDHTDGIKRRYTEVSLAHAPGVPSHMVLDDERAWLYIADTGNKRVIRVDVREATNVGNIQSFFGDGILSEFTGVIQETVVGEGVMEAPSGLALYNGILFVSDNATGKLHAFKTDGEQVNELDTGFGPGALAGIAVGPVDNILYLVNQIDNRVLRVLP